jgi:FixJ family two-component response regulator
MNDGRRTTDDGRRTWTIIVAEDDVGLNRLVSRRLEKQGYPTVSALNGADAVARALEHERVLLLLDYVLPDMKASDVLNTLSEQGRVQPFIIMTGRGDEALAVAMMKQGACDYLIKSGDFVEHLPDVISRVLHLLETEELLRAGQTELRESEERFRLIADNIPDGLILVEGRTIRYVNQRTLDIFGYSSDELAELGMFGAIAPEDRLRVWELVEGLSGERTGDRRPEAGPPSPVSRPPSSDIEFWIQRNDGSRRYVNARFATGSEQGKPVVLAVVRDITEDERRASNVERRTSNVGRRTTHDARRPTD